MKLTSYKHATRTHCEKADVVRSCLDKLHSRARVNRRYDREPIDLDYCAPPVRSPSVVHVAFVLPRFPDDTIALTSDGRVIPMPATLDEIDTDGRRVVRVLTTH